MNQRMVFSLAQNGWRKCAVPARNTETRLRPLAAKKLGPLVARFLPNEQIRKDTDAGHRDAPGRGLGIHVRVPSTVYRVPSTKYSRWLMFFDGLEIHSRKQI